MTKIYTVDALAGAGKTYSAIQFTLKRAKIGAKFIIAQPSKILLDETFNSFSNHNKNDIKVTRIDSSTSSNVAADVMNHFRNADSQGEIVLITHKTLLNLPYWHKPNEWNLIIDEAIEPLIDLSYNNATHHKIITDYVKLTSCGLEYSIITPKDDASSKILRDYASDHLNDSYNKLHADLASAITSEHHTVYAEAQNYDKIAKNKAKSNKPQTHTMLLFSELKPSIFAKFKSVTMMAATIAERTIYKLWANQGVEFVKHEAISKSLRYTRHENKNVSIYYCTDRKWSGSLKNKEVDGVDVFGHIVYAARELIKDDPYIFIANNSVGDSQASDYFEGGKRVPVVSHGLNEFSTFDNVVFTPATNPTPQFYKFARFRKLDADEVDLNTYLQNMYQCIMRSSLRDPTNTNPKRVFVPDLTAAQHLAKLFPNAELHQIGTVQDMPAAAKGHRTGKYVDDAARAKHHRQRTAAANALIAECKELGLNPATKCFTAIASIHSTDLYRETVNSNDELINSLEDAFKNAIKTKDSAMLISPASFKKVEGVTTTRGLANIESIYGIWFDVDGGHMKMSDVKNMLPNIRIVMFDTFSGKGRYRIFIPTKTPMSFEVDKIVKNEILNLMEKQGFSHESSSKKFSGIDRSKITPSSFFYAPASNAHRTKNVFDRSHNDHADYELDPATIIENAEIEVPAEATYTAKPTDPDSKLEKIRARLKLIDSTRNNDEIIEKAVATYKAVPKGMGLRNGAFFVFGATLKNAGLSLSEIENTLKQHADDDDRKKQIPSILNSLKRYKK